LDAEPDEVLFVVALLAAVLFAVVVLAVVFFLAALLAYGEGVWVST
jgi:hypothetical protein